MASFIRHFRKAVTGLFLPGLKLYTEWVILGFIPVPRWISRIILARWLTPVDPFVDRDFYLAQITDPSMRRSAARDPTMHYFLVGRFDDYAPNPEFDPIFYRANNPQLAWASYPLMHFATEDRNGVANEGRSLPLLRPPAATQDAILILHHGRGGGSSQYLQLYEEKLSSESAAVYRLVRVSRKRPLFRLLDRQSGIYHGRAFDLTADDSYFLELCRQFSITRFVANHIVDLPQAITKIIPEFCQKAGIPFDVVLHDYLMICPRLNLVDGSRHYCGEPPVEQCRLCVAENGADFDVDDPAIWRRDAEDFVRAAQSVIAPSDDVRQRLERYWAGRQIAVWQPEGVQIFPEPKPIRLAEGEKLRIAVIGTLNVIKGYHILLTQARRTTEQNLPLQFTLIGESINDSTLRQQGVNVHGRYREPELPAILQSLAPHMIFQPSVCPETWSFVTSAALKQGIPVYAFDLGAIAERLRKLGRKTVIPWPLVYRAADLTHYFLAVRKTALADGEPQESGLAQAHPATQ